MSVIDTWERCERVDHSVYIEEREHEHEHEHEHEMTCGLIFWKSICMLFDQCVYIKENTELNVCHS